MPRGNHNRWRKVTASRAVTCYDQLRTRAIKSSDALQVIKRGTLAGLRSTLTESQSQDNEKDRPGEAAPLVFPCIPDVKGR